MIAMLCSASWLVVLDVDDCEVLLEAFLGGPIFCLVENQDLGPTPFPEVTLGCKEGQQPQGRGIIFFAQLTRSSTL